MKHDSRRFAGEKSVAVSLAISVAMILAAVMSLAAWKHLGWFAASVHELGLVK
jgi:hypothetical protein